MGFIIAGVVTLLKREMLLVESKLENVQDGFEGAILEKQLDNLDEAHKALTAYLTNR